jgi:hypothetical protein
VHTSGPAAWATNAFGQFGVRTLHATRAGFDQFGTFNPTNPLVACQWGYVMPGCKCGIVSSQCFAQVGWQFVDRSAQDILFSHIDILHQNEFVLT